MLLTTFGCEAEYSTGVPALVQYLYSQGLCPYPQMHQWHCGCDECRRLDASPYLFRAQTDSSCSGEIITRVLDFRDEDDWPTNPFAALQEAALFADAEPGLDAGHHVHVGIDHLSYSERRDALMAFLVWEPRLEELSAGRWGSGRGANNTVRATLHGHIRRSVDRGLGQDRDWFQAFVNQRLHTRADVADGLFDIHWDADRHTNLNLNTGHGTFEYRLWNSTRSAWRMEMFARLSVALVDPSVVARLLTTNPYTADDPLDKFCVILHETGHERAAELAFRQTEYLSERVQDAPSILTNF